MNYLIETPSGIVKGYDGKNESIIAFKGIRYATANRFELPKEVTNWDGVYDAKEYGNCCYQPRSFYNEEENKKKYFYYKEFRKGETYTYSEDCLFLNIWIPKNYQETENLPVIVYIHGGGYKGGCGHELHFDEPVWPLKDVIAITINYRLGPLGFACVDDVGNFGLYDQVCALNWIKHNISSFKGDPNNITIMGQSAGAMSIQQLCMSSLTKGLFHKAVMSSGGGVHKILSTQTKEKASLFWDKVKEIAGCKTVDEFKKLDINKLFEAWNIANAKQKIPMMTACPIIDNYLITENGINAVKKEHFHNIPYMIGSTSEDMMAPFMHSMSLNWCLIQEKPAYCWMFNHKLPGDDEGAWHSSDLWYWFGTLKNSWRPFTEVDYRLSDYMVSYLTNFAKYGNPNYKGLPLWDNTFKKQKRVIHFNHMTPYMSNVNKKKLWKNLFTKKAVGE